MSPRSPREVSWLCVRARGPVWASRPGLGPPFRGRGFAPASSGPFHPRPPLQRVWGPDTQLLVPLGHWQHPVCLRTARCERELPSVLLEEVPEATCPPWECGLWVGPRSLPSGQTAFLLETLAQRETCVQSPRAQSCVGPHTPRPPQSVSVFISLVHGPRSQGTTGTAGAPGWSGGSDPWAHDTPTPKTRCRWGLTPGAEAVGKRQHRLLPALRPSPRKPGRGTRHLVLGVAMSFPGARACASVCGRVYTGAHVCAHVCARGCAHVCGHVHVCVCVLVCAYLHTCSVCVCARLCVCLPSTPPCRVMPRQADLVVLGSLALADRV